MPDQQDDLQATEDSVGRDAEQVQALEGAKARLDPDDPRVPQISEQAERVAAGLHAKTVAERELSEKI